MKTFHSTIRLIHYHKSIVVIPLWEKKKDLSSFDISTRPFDMEWVRTLPRLFEIEDRNFDKLVSKKHKAQTVCVYFLNGLPCYLHRRSTIDARYDWLIKVTESNLENYKAKTALAQAIKEQKANRKLKELTVAEQERAAALKIERKKEEQKELDRRIKADKARIVQQIKDKFEKEKYDLKKHHHFCMHQAYIWLNGHTTKSLHNSEAWRLAEEEDSALF